jgi:hypothetical protein
MNAVLESIKNDPAIMTGYEPIDFGIGHPEQNEELNLIRAASIYLARNSVGANPSFDVMPFAIRVAVAAMFISGVEPQEFLPLQDSDGNFHLILARREPTDRTWRIDHLELPQGKISDMDINLNSINHADHGEVFESLAEAELSINALRAGALAKGATHIINLLRRD